MKARAGVGLIASCALILAIAVTAPGAPDLDPIADQTVREGLLFASIRAAELVRDPEYAFEDLTWTFTGAVELQVLPYLDRLMIRIPDDEWYGSETIRFEVCNPAGECASREAAFTVLAVNDPPVLDRIPHQVLRPGEPFDPIPLIGFATDIDDAVEALTWAVEGQSELDVSIEDDVLTVTAPASDWIGAETLRVRACDPAGDCAEREVVFAHVDDRAIVLTHVHNAGFAIEGGGVRVLMDALLAQGVASELQRAMRAAEPPFDADLILITHSHSDHFDTTIVADNLRANPDSIVVSTADVVHRIAHAVPGIDEGRLIAVDLAEKESTVVEAGGLAISVYEFPHGVPNVGFLLRLGPWAVFHPGDVADTGAREWFVHYALADEGIDVALVPWFLMTTPEYHAALTAGLQARWYVPMHFTAGFARTCEGASAAFPNTICFSGPMDVWIGFAEAD